MGSSPRGGAKRASLSTRTVGGLLFYSTVVLSVAVCLTNKKGYTMRTTFSIAFYCRASKQTKQGLSPLEMSITVNSQRLFLNLPTKFPPTEFNRKHKPEYIDRLLATYRVNATKVLNDLMDNGLPITARSIRQYMKTGGIRSKTIQELWDEYLELIRPRIGSKMTYKTFKKYETTRSTFLSFNAPTSEITALTSGDMTRFYDYLKARYMDSTSAQMMTKVKTVFHYAWQEGYIKTDITSTIKIHKGSSKVEYLTEAELEQIENADLGGCTYLERARDLLLFIAYGGGMAYCDLIRFRPEKMVKQGDVYTYTDRRQKTGVTFTTVLLPKAVSLLQRYGYNLPLISNQRLNSYAKVIGQAAHISTPLHTHLFRKSYATMLRQHNVPLETIALCLGHTSSYLTAKLYAFAQDSTIAEQVSSRF